MGNGDGLLPLLKHGLHNIGGFKHKDFANKVRHLRVENNVCNLEFNISQPRFNCLLCIHLFVPLSQSQLITFSSSSMVRASSSTSVAASVRVTISFCLACSSEFTTLFGLVKDNFECSSMKPPLRVPWCQPWYLQAFGSVLQTCWSSADPEEKSH